MVILRAVIILSSPSNGVLSLSLQLLARRGMRETPLPPASRILIISRFACNGVLNMADDLMSQQKRRKI